MKVIALKPCFFGGVYRKIGEIFTIDESKLKKGPDGKPILSKSSTPAVKVVIDEREARAEAEKIKSDADKKQVAGAIAASGGKAAKDKVDAARDLAG